MPPIKISLTTNEIVNGHSKDDESDHNSTAYSGGLTTTPEQSPAKNGISERIDTPSSPTARRKIFKKKRSKRKNVDDASSDEEEVRKKPRKEVKKQDAFQCTYEGCGKPVAKHHRLRHIVKHKKHLWKDEKKNFPRGDGNYFKCPYGDCPEISTTEAAQIRHLALFHKEIEKKLEDQDKSIDDFFLPTLIDVDLALVSESEEAESEVDPPRLLLETLETEARVSQESTSQETMASVENDRHVDQYGEVIDARQDMSIMVQSDDESQERVDDVQDGVDANVVRGENGEVIGQNEQDDILNYMSDESG